MGPAALKKEVEEDASAHERVFRVYLRVWAVAQIAEFWYGSLAGRAPYDVAQVVACAACALVPSNRVVRVVALWMRAGGLATRVPNAFDGEWFAAITDATTAAAALWPRALVDTGALSAAIRWQVGVFYAAAGFIKLNSGFLTPRTSCASTYAVQIVQAFLGTREYPKISALAYYVAAPATVAVELGVGVLALMGSPSSTKVAVGLGTLLHVGIAATPPPNNIAAFGTICAARYALLGDSLPAVMRDAPLHVLAGAAAASAALVGLTQRYHGSPGAFQGGDAASPIDWAAGMYGSVAAIACTVVFGRRGPRDAESSSRPPSGTQKNIDADATRDALSESSSSARRGGVLEETKEGTRDDGVDHAKKKKKKKKKTSTDDDDKGPLRSSSSSTVVFFFKVGAAALMATWCFGPIILGVMDGGSPNMFSNVRMQGGSNHLVMPTGLLQHWHAADRDSVFSGGYVRVEATNSTRLASIHPGDLSDVIDPRARATLRALGAPGLFWNPTVASVVGPAAMPPNHRRHRYTLPAWELHRVLRDEAAAAAAAAPVSITYTVLPGTRGDEHWRRTAGDKTIEATFAPAYPHIATCGVVRGPPGATCARHDLFFMNFRHLPDTWLNRLGTALQMWNSYVVLDDDHHETELHCYGS